MAHDGYPYIGSGFAAVIILSISGNIFEMNLLFYLAGLSGFLTLFFMMFFRDPERIKDYEHGEIISPGDGHVVAIVEEEEPDYFKAKIKRVSIFLSVFDVHINRIPVNGTVEYFKSAKKVFSGFGVLAELYPDRSEAFEAVGSSWIVRAVAFGFFERGDEVAFRLEVISRIEVGLSG